MFKILDGLDTHVNKQGHTLYLVTPAWVKAQDLLSGDPKGFNRNNRRYDKQKAKEYERMITDGKWDPLVGELHIVDQPDDRENNGRLVSGQHRLMGILMANTPTWVRFTGCSLMAALHVDTGRSRSYGQNVSMFTDSTYAQDEAVAKSVVSVLEYLITGKYRPSGGQNHITRVLGDTIFLEVRNKWLSHFSSVRKLGVSPSFNRNVVKAFITILRAANAQDIYIDKILTIVTIEKGDDFCLDRINSYSNNKTPTSLMILLVELWRHTCTCSMEQGYSSDMPHVDAYALLTELSIPVDSISGVGKGKRKKTV